MVGVTGSIPVAPTIFFKGLGAVRLAGEEMISTKFPRRPSGSQVTRLPVPDATGFASGNVGLDDDAEAQPCFPHVTPKVTPVRACTLPSATAPIILPACIIRALTSNLTAWQTR